MRKVKKESGRCVFCGGGKLTKEHIWSDWMNKILPPATEHTQGGFYSFRDNGSKTEHVVPNAPKVRQGAMTKRKVRSVCGSCNSGWMSAIVNRAKPFAEKMILGHPCQLDAQAQIDLSSWIAIASIMAELTDPPTVGIAFSDRKFLMESKKPPRTWTICIGRYEGTKYAPSSYHHRFSAFIDLLVPRPSGIGPTDLDKLQFTTSVLGSLVVHAFSSTSPGGALRLRSRFTPSNMIPIWPRTVRVISWPASPLLGDDAMKVISDSAILSILKTNSI